MAVGANTFSQRTIIIGVLLVGGCIFVLPFINMLSTSIKLDEEMAAENFSIFPSRPIPRQVSPYVRSSGPAHFQRPADLPQATWDALHTPLRASLRQRVQAWYDHQPFIHESFSAVDPTNAVETLTEVLGTMVLERLSDLTRQAGVEAMCAAAPKLVDDAMILEAFNDFVPRLTLGQVQVRLADFSKRPLGSGSDWVAVRGAQVHPLPSTTKGGQIVSLVEYSHPTPNWSVRITTAAFPGSSSPSPPPTTSLASLSPTEAASVDRVYLSFQSDQSWGKINIRITQAGRLYELAESLYAAERKWTELELRLPGREPLPTSGRTFLLLRDSGPAPTTEPFTVEFALTPTSQAGAWWAKLSRNYVTAFRQVPITRYIATSVSLAILSILLTVFGSSLTAYGFARLDFPGKNILFIILLATMMIPGQVTMIPNFLIYRSFGWYNTLLPLWVPAIFGSAFFIFMMRQFFLAIPKELEDAARIDGCGFFGTYWYIMLPLLRPTLVTVAIFAFMGSWNNFMGLLIYVNDERLYNLAFGLFKFQLTSGSSSGLMMAGAFVMTLPIIALFFIFQRYFIQGITLTGLGGK